MKIKHPVNFAMGIFGLLCFVSDIVNRMNIFVIALIAMLTVGNIMCGLID